MYSEVWKKLSSAYFISRIYNVNFRLLILFLGIDNVNFRLLILFSRIDNVT